MTACNLCPIIKDDYIYRGVTLSQLYSDRCVNNEERGSFWGFK